MAEVTLRGVRKIFGAFEAIKNVALEIKDGEFAVFVGPSGCGKSTLLRMIAGLEDVDYGSIYIGDRDVTEVAPARREVAMVFQNYALYPHMTAYDNMAYGLRRAGKSREEIEGAVQAAAEMLQITELLDRKPRAMSGGQRQRIAIGRAIVRQPKVFLFDEPLSNLDAALRVDTRAQISGLHRQLKSTMIFVTHDQIEAMTLADRIVVLNAGRIEQVGTPREVYHTPANTFVAKFIGSPSMNLFSATVKDGKIDAGLSEPLEISGYDLEEGASVSVGLRPDALALVDDGVISAEVVLVEHLGGETIIHAKSETHESIITKISADVAVDLGERISLSPDMTQAHVFGSDGVRLSSKK